MRIPPFLRGMLIIAAVAAIILVLNLETALSTAALLVRVAFFLAIAFVVYLLWRDFGRKEIGYWDSRKQWVFYCAAALFVLDLGWWFLATLTGPDLLVFFLVAGACIYAGVRTWREQRHYG
jgi:amino acid transporter